MQITSSWSAILRPFVNFFSLALEKRWTISFAEDYVVESDNIMMMYTLYISSG